MEHALLTAALSGDTEKIKEEIENGCDPNQPDELGRTVLHWLAQYDASDCGDAINTLCKGGAHRDICDSQGNIPLHHAVLHAQQISTFLALMLPDGRQDANPPNHAGETPLHWLQCAQGKTVWMAYIAAQNKTDINVRDDQGRSPLLWALMNENYEAADALLEHRADPNACDALGRTPLYWTTYWAQRSGVFKREAERATDPPHPHSALLMFQKLIDAGADLDRADEAAAPLLMEGKSIRKWHADTAPLQTPQDRLRLIMRASLFNSSPRWEARHLEEMLEHLAERNHLRLPEWLADVSEEGTPLTFILVNASLPLDWLKRLKHEAGADLTKKTKHKHSLLIWACTRNQADVVSWLVRQNPELLNQKDKFGNTALHVTAEAAWCHAETFLALIAAGADVHARNELGNTPLHTAAPYHETMYRYNPHPFEWTQEQHDVCCILLAAGADPHATNLDGHTPCIGQDNPNVHPRPHPVRNFPAISNLENRPAVSPAPVSPQT